MPTKMRHALPVLAVFLFSVPTLLQGQESNCESPEFHGARNFPILFQSTLNSIAIGDFNEDGHVDLVGSGKSAFSVLYGEESGGFEQYGAIAAGDYSQDVVSSDFNGDGHADLALANVNSSDVSVFLGDGIGGFLPSTRFTVGTHPYSLATADFNEDGIIDAATANRLSDDVSILLGDGIGGFEASVEVAVGGNPRDVEGADFNNDGHTDLAVANSGADTVSILLGDGAGGFSSAIDSATERQPWALATGDLDNNGNLDLVVANNGSKSVSVLLGDGSGGFTPVAVINTGSFLNDVDLADLDTDGNLDLVVGTSYGRFNVYSGDGTGGFSSHGWYVAGDSYVSVVIFDFTLDGILDLAVAHGENITDNQYIAIFEGDGSGKFISAPQIGHGQNPNEITLSDFNMDGHTDLAVVYLNTSLPAPTLKVMFGNGLGDFNLGVDSFYLGDWHGGVTSSDLDGDGSPEIIVADTPEDSIQILWNDGTGVFGVPSLFATGDGPIQVLAADFNLDGNNDLAVINTFSYTISVFLGDGAGGFAVNEYSTDGKPMSSAVADFNGDTWMDLAVSIVGGDHGEVLVYLGDGIGGFESPRTVSLTNKTQHLAVGDVNSDTHPDIVTVYHGAITVILGDGIGGFTESGTFPNAYLPFSAALEDLNRDGHLDLMMANLGWSSVSILLGDGIGGFSEPVNYFADEPAFAIASDINHDGFPDLAVANRISDRVSILLNTCGPSNQAPVAYDDSFDTTEDTGLWQAAPGVLANDQDQDDDLLIANLNSEASHGALSLSIDGSFTYDPVDNFCGSDFFTYSAYDGTVNSNTATVSIEVTCINDDPTISSDVLGITVDEGSQATMAGSSYDVEEDFLTFSSSIGTVSGNSDSWSWYYTPQDGSSDSQTVTIFVDDGNGGLANTSFKLVVVNVAPTATFSAPSSVDEGTDFTLSLASPLDPSPTDSTAGFEYSFNCGNGYAAYGSTDSVICTTTDNEVRTVGGKIRDKDGGETEYTAAVTVNNVAPTASFSAPASVNEGSDIALSLTSPSDPSSADTNAGFQYAFDCGSGYGAFGSSSSASCPTTENEVRTVGGKIRDKDGGESEYTASVTVFNLPPVVSVNPTSQTIQYSDEIAQVSITATDGPSDPLTATPSWSVNGSGFSPGLPANLSLNLNNCDVNGQTSCSWIISGIVDVPAGTYTVRITVEDDDGGQTTEETVLIVDPEDASVDFDSDNPVAVKVAAPGEASGPFSLTIYVHETVPDTAVAAAYPGDISRAHVSMSLQPVGPGGIETGTCVPGAVTGNGYDAILAVTCNFNEVPVNTYSIVASVVGGYYIGMSEDVLTVYDPSLGFASCGGWFYWPGTTDKTNFGCTMKYNKKATKVQGSLLLIRHLSDDSIYRVKSNALYGLALGEVTTPPYGWASFNGKATYMEPGWPEAVGNHEFVVYVEDRDDPGTGTDRFWIEVMDKDGELVPLSMSRDAPTNAEGIGGGNIVVPH